MTLKFSIVAASRHLEHFVKAMDIRDFDFWQGAVVEFRMCTGT